MVPKGNAEWRPCGDYRRLNDIMTADRYPIQQHSTWPVKPFFSKIDLIRNYHHIFVHENDIAKTAIIILFGLYEFCWIPFGLRNTAETFQWFIDEVSCLDFVFVYPDDISVAGSCLEHPMHLIALFRALSDHGLVTNPPKCVFGKSKVTSEVKPLAQMVSVHTLHVSSSPRIPSSPGQESLTPVCWPGQLLPSLRIQIQMCCDLTAPAPRFGSRQLHLDCLLLGSI